MTLQVLLRLKVNIQLIYLNREKIELVLNSAVMILESDVTTSNCKKDEEKEAPRVPSGVMAAANHRPPLTLSHQ